MKKVRSYASVKRPHKAKPKTRITKRRVTRGGRNSDPKKLTWLREQHCAVGYIGCSSEPYREVHHVRLHGSRATDKRTIPLCANHHRLGHWSVHYLGVAEFDHYFGVKLEMIAENYERRWQAEKARP